MRRALRWLGLLLSLTLLLTWFVSRWYAYNYHASRGRHSITIDLSRGQCSIQRFASTRPMPPTRRARHAFYSIPADTPRAWHWRFDSIRQTNPVGSFSIHTFPLWPLVLIVALPTSLALVRHRRATRAARANTCPTCRYPLTGLTPDAPCPECGTPIHTPPRTD